MSASSDDTRGGSIAFFAGLGCGLLFCLALFLQPFSRPADEPAMASGEGLHRLSDK